MLNIDEQLDPRQLNSQLNSRSSRSRQSAYSISEIQQLKQELKQQQKQLEIRDADHRQFLVNTGFSFEITDYFKFQNQNEVDKEHNFFKHINQRSYIAWIILLYYVLSSAMIPPWLMTIKADKLLRISWKCLMHLVMITPFVLYEHRTGSQKTKEQHKLKYIFAIKNIKKVWWLAFTASFWPTTILTTIEWTYISHCMVLGSMTNYFLCIQRIIQNRSSRMEIIGIVAASLGIIFVMYDSVSLNVNSATDYQWNVFNYFYLTRTWWQRVLGDLGALTIGFCMSQLSKQTADIKQYYPPYLLLFLNNLFTCIFMVFSAYFFNGATFDFNSQWGVFALLTTAHFTNFLYMSLVLTMGTFIAFVMVIKIFNDPIVPAIAMALEPILSTPLFHLAGVQTIPGPYACFGYMLITPSMIAIISGNCLDTRNKAKVTKNIKQKPLKIVVKDQNQKIQQMDQFFDQEQY